MRIGMTLARPSGWLGQTRNRTLRVLFIGAGGANFGGATGPWDNSKRVEDLGGVRIVAIADPDIPKAQALLKTKRGGTRDQLYSECKVYASYIDAVDATKPDVALIGEHMTVTHVHMLRFHCFWNYFNMPNYSVMPKPCIAIVEGY